MANNGDESIPPDQCGFSKETSILLYQTTLVTRFFPALFTESSGEQGNQAVIRSTRTKASDIRKVRSFDKNELSDKNGISILLYPTTLVTRFYPALFSESSWHEKQLVIQSAETKASATKQSTVSDKTEISTKENFVAKSGSRCGRSSLLQRTMPLLAKILCGLHA